jgi:hypothetical protein
MQTQHILELIFAVLMSFNLYKLLIVAAVFGLCGQLLAQPGLERKFRISAGKAEDTLKAFARQAEMPVLFFMDQVSGHETQALEGKFSCSQALSTMLRDSGLEFTLDDETGAILINASGNGSVSQQSASGGNASRAGDSLNNNLKLDETMNKQNGKPSFWRKLLFAVGIIGATTPNAALAQELDDQQEEEVFELSPFQVTGSDDEGYYATQSLAGTRLKSNIRDVGASISIITEEFMEDTASVDASELLIYTAGTETGGFTGNFSAGSTGNSINGGIVTLGARLFPQFATRVRGLGSPDITRNYFLSRIPFDDYNTDRVEINRGANSILFGLGSPAGILNNTTVQPQFTDFGKLGLRMDNYGTFRSTLDLNHELIDDKLAIRVALLHEDIKYRQEPTYEKDQRIYAAATWKITDSTTLRVNGELGEIRANRPSVVAPMESLSSWILMGNPIVDSSPVLITAGLNSNWDTSVRLDGEGAAPGSGANLPASPVTLRLGPGATYSSADAVAPADFVFGSRFFNRSTALLFSQPTLRDPDGSVDQIRGQHTATFSGAPLHPLDLDGEADDLNYSVPSDISTMYGTGYIMPTLLDRQAFDWVNNFLPGDNPFQNNDFEQVNVTLEQLFLDGKAGLEAAYDYQSFEQNAFVIQDQTHPIWIDTMLYLPLDLMENPTNPVRNPNYLRPFTLMRTNALDWEYENEALRITGFYEFDFEDVFDSRWGDWLGRHTFTGMYNTQEFNRTNSVGVQAWSGSVLRNTSQPQNGFHAQVNHLVYLGAPVDPNADSMDDFAISRLNGAQIYRPNSTATVTYWENGVAPGTANGFNLPSSSAAATDEFLAIGGSDGTGNIQTTEAYMPLVTIDRNVSRQVVDTAALTFQSFLFSDNLVFTGGWREDQVEEQQIGAGAFERNVDGALVVSGPGLPDVKDAAKTRIEESIFSWSLVGYLPEEWIELPYGTRLSLHYADSSNFQPGSSAETFAGKSISAPTGETKEYGFTLTSLNNRLAVRVNWYETSVLNNPRGFIGTGSNFISLPVRELVGVAQGSQDSSTPEGQAAILAESAARFVVSEFDQDTVNNLNLSNIDGFLAGTDAVPTSTPNIRDSEDVTAEGLEIEMVYNVTPNWRVALNVAKQDAVISNIAPGSEAAIREAERVYALTIPGTNVTFGELPALGLTQFFPNESGRDRFGSVFGGNNADTLNDQLRRQFTIPLDTAKSQEGRQSDELREWRVNLITNYTFREGRFEGVGIGGAVRYQSKSAIGYPFIDVDGDGNLDVADVTRPYYDDAETNYDFWVSYDMPFFRDIGNWSIQLNIRNAFSESDDYIPIRAQPDGQVAAVRASPQRTFILSSTFEF